MTTSHTTLLTRATLAVMLFASALAPVSAATIAEPLGRMADPGVAVREIRIVDGVKSINVLRHESIRFVNAAGEKFTWHFDTLHHPIIPMSKLAPAGFNMKEVLIYVGQGVNERS